jgi:hypothetical protein
MLQSSVTAVKDALRRQFQVSCVNYIYIERAQHIERAQRRHISVTQLFIRQNVFYVMTTDDACINSNIMRNRNRMRTAVSTMDA